jgi:DNA-binding IclR family transcriptional regulator
MEKRLEMTPQQAIAFDMLLAMTRELGRAPSLSEIGKRMGLSKAGVAGLMRRLRKMGAVTAPVLVGDWCPTPLGKKLRRQA